MKWISLVTVLALGFFWTAAARSGQSAQSSQPGTGDSAQQTAEQKFKNIQVLKGIPADQLLPTMFFISASLGVECDFCHLEQREKDDKKAKQTARKMIQMQMAINKENFEGHTRVTCNSCHQGRHEPLAIPLIPDENAKPQAAEAQATKPEAGPTADQLLSKYVQALGGAEALQKITSRVEKGTLTGGRGQSASVELFAKDPDKKLFVMHTPKGDRLTVFDGTIAWSSNPGAPANKLDPANAEAVKLDAEFNLALRVKQIFKQLRVGRPDKIKDRDVDEIFALQPGQAPVRLSFDKQSGLLLRLVRYAETPLGRLPTQIDYDDYRDAGGVKIPYRWAVATPQGRYTIQIEQVQQNVPIDDGKFAMPLAGQ